MKDPVRPLTLSDIAQKLGVSKSTVSRVVNYKGRISTETRKRVLDLVNSVGYEPFSARRALFPKRTDSIGVVLPKDAEKGEIPFFQSCVTGISQSVYDAGFDVVVAFQGKNDNTPLRRLVQRRKADGFVLTRLESQDEAVSFLRDEGVPFIVIGTSPNEDFCQIDSDHISGCREMTEFMIGKGCRHVAVLAGNRKHVVNDLRLEGFNIAMREACIPIEEEAVFWDIAEKEDVFCVLPDIMKKNPQCIVCLDDVICVYVLQWLRMNDYEVPTDIQLISFYDNGILENITPPVTALNIDIAELTKKAALLLVDMIEGKKVPLWTKVDYEMKIRESFR